MEILATIWQIIQILLLISLIISAGIALIAIFHPLRFDLKLRGSVKGQRAEVWFVYLFRWFKIGVIATPHTQDVVVSFAGWQKRLSRAGRKKPEKAPPATPSSPETSQDTPAESVSVAPEHPTGSSAEMTGEITIDPGKVRSEPTSEISGDKSDSETTPEAATGILATADTTAASQTKPADATTLSEEPSQPAENGKTAQVESPAHQQTHADAETVEPVPIEASTAAPEIDSRPLKPLGEVEAEYKAAKEAGATAQDPSKSGSSAGSSLKQALRRFKRDASRRFNQLKVYARLFRQKWRALSPVCKRFWQRGKSGFGLPRIDLLLRYALHEPYLTGMFHGNLAVASGMAGQFGINFVPVPQFGAPMLYSRAYLTAVIRPWRLIYATVALLFEKQLYQELWQLFKWYRSKKQL